MPSPAKIDRRTVDLSAYPDLVVIVLGMKVLAPRGLRTVGRLGPQIARSAAAEPDGLLLHETFFFSLFPLHVGMRQYWRDLDSLERWTRSPPHKEWWTDFLRDPGGTAFWHETYSVRGGFEAIYDGHPDQGRPGFAAFAPMVAAKGRMFSARARLTGATAPDAPVAEAELE